MRIQLRAGSRLERRCRTRCPIFSGCLPPPRVLHPSHRGWCLRVQQVYDVRRRPFCHCPVVRVSTCEGYIPFFTHVEWAVPRICVRGRCIRHGGLRAKHHCIHLHIALPGYRPREKYRNILTNGLRIRIHSNCTCKLQAGIISWRNVLRS